MFSLAQVAGRAGTERMRLPLGDSGDPDDVVVLVDARRADNWSAETVVGATAALRQCERIVVMLCDSRTPAGLADRADVLFSETAVSLPSIVAPDPEAAAAELVSAIGRAPRASVVLVWHLRASEHLAWVDGMVAESATFSVLQGNPEYRRWLGTRPPPRPTDPGPRIAVRREADELRITLDRPGRRNALDRHMRAELIEALQVAVLDPSLSVTLEGAGPVFCAGGDLDEFGSTPDPATSHLIRVVHNVGRELAGISARTTALVHGACVGAGIEIAAFCGRVVARTGSTFRLPEVGMGLIPGAGGTVSITARIGRHRFAWLALTGNTVGVDTALAWGLVDAVE